MSHVHGSCRSLLSALVCLACLSVGCAEPEAGPEPDPATIHGAVLLYYQAHHVDPDHHVAEDDPPLRLVIRKSSAVYSEVHNEEPLPSDLPPECVPEGATTWADLERACVLYALEDSRPETWAAFVAATAEPQDLSSVVGIPGRVLLITQDDLNGLFPDDIDPEGIRRGYRNFLKRNPGAIEITAVSMPGLSPDGAQALIYVEGSRGCLAGSGVYYLLVREPEGGIWKVVDYHVAWIS